MSANNRRMSSTTVYFPPEMLERLKRYADATKVPGAEVVRRALESELSRLGYPKLPDPELGPDEHDQ